MKIDVSPEVHQALSIQAALKGTTSKALADEILFSAIGSDVWELVRKTKSTSVHKSKPPEVRKTIKAESNNDQKDIVAKAKKYILAELEAGREPTVKEVAAHVGVESRPLGTMLNQAGIKNTVCRRNGKQARRYTVGGQ